MLDSYIASHRFGLSVNAVRHHAVAHPNPQSMATFPREPMTSTTYRPTHWFAAPLLALCASAWAGGPAVPDPNVWTQLPPAEQTRQRAALKQQLEQASPSEREAFRQQLRQKLMQLSPDERQALVEATRQRWNAMPAEERQRLADERRQKLSDMPASERERLRKQRQEMLQKLSPAERAALREKLPTQ